MDTYAQHVVSTIGEQGYGLSTPKSNFNSRFVRIFLAAERSEQKLEIQQCFRKPSCNAFASLHEKGTSVEPIVQEINDALRPRQDIKPKGYEFLRIGTKWLTIVEEFASIIESTPQHATGLLCLLGSPSA